MISFSPINPLFAEGEERAVQRSADRVSHCKADIAANKYAPPALSAAQRRPGELSAKQPFRPCKNPFKKNLFQY
jgi:hypothetical protein